MACVAPRSTLSHCGSLNALDQRVPVLPSTALPRPGRWRSPSTTRSPAAPATAASRRRRRHRRAVDRELPQRVAVGGGPGGAVHPDVPAGAGHRQIVRTAVTGGGRVDVRPGGAVGRGLDLVRPPVRGLPVQRHVAMLYDWPEVDLEPLRVGERARPAGTGVAVGGVGRAEGRVLAARTRWWACPGRCSYRRRRPPPGPCCRRPPSRCSAGRRRWWRRSGRRRRRPGSRRPSPGRR